MPEMNPLRAAAFAVAFALPAGVALADYPTGPVQFVVPWPPGDLEDVLTRMIAEDFQDAYGQPAAVLNRPGGGGGPFPGAIDVALARPDGSMIGSFVISVPLVGPRLGIPELDPNPFEPVGIFRTYPFVIATTTDAPYQSIEQLVDHAQENEVLFGHLGNEILPTRVSFALAASLGFAWGEDAAFDAIDCGPVAAGDVDVFATTIQLVLPCLDEVTVIATITPERLPMAPDAPTVAELDPELTLTLWNGLFVHKDTPAEIRTRIAQVASQTVTSERAQQFAADTGAQVYWMGADAAKAQIERDAEALARIQAMLGE
jgi:tripartite-type tricarboxylate transporter receptor subunit TctC